MSKAPIIRIIPGYTYRRIIGTVLRKVRGKARRVRYNVYKTVTVPPREVVVRAKKRKAIKLAPKRRAKAKPKVAPKPKPKAAVSPQASLDKWYAVGDYQRALIAQREMDGSETEEVENEIFHSDPDSDVINSLNLFVWYKPVLPTNIVMSYRGVNGKIVKSRRPFRMVRIWFFVFHTTKQVYRLWCRSSVLDFESDFAEVYARAVELHAEVAQAIKEKYTYLEVRELVAWTAYKLKERARRRDRRSKDKLGGT